MTLWDQILCWQATETPTLLGLSEKGGRRCPRPQPGTMGTTGSKVLRGGEQHPAQLGSCALEGPGSTPRREEAPQTPRGTAGFPATNWLPRPVIYKDSEPSRAPG